VSDGPALLAAILAHPAEDTPRLAYADWLQEQGDDERAEFIRVQIELARTDPFDGWECIVCGNRPSLEGSFDGAMVEHGKGCYTLFGDGGGSEFVEVSDRYKLLRARELELLVGAAKRHLPWTPPGLTFWLKGEPDPHVPAYMKDREYLVGLFVRGFIERVTGTAAKWIERGHAILAEQPVRRVRLTTLPEFYIHRLVEKGSDVTRCHAVIAGKRIDVAVSIAAPALSPLLCERWPGVEFELPQVQFTDLEQFAATP
jgi:uncharacterized protein (TIGR02996 family)